MQSPLGLIFRPVPRTAFRVSIAVYLLLRVFLASLPGYTWDMEMIKTWSLGIALNGLSKTYESTSVDYPPLYVYLLHPIGKLYLALHPELQEREVVRHWDELRFETNDGARYRSKWQIRDHLPSAKGAGPLPGSRLFSVMIKAPGLAFDFASAGILYALVATTGAWGSERRKSGWGRLAATLYLWNPAVLWGSGYWGLPDAIHSALMLGCIALVGAGRLFGSAASLSAGGLMKPLAAPLLPLFVVTATLQRGFRGFLVAGAGGFAVAALLFLPFLLRYGVVIIQSVLFQIERMPKTTMNAHNLWWLLGQDWQDASTPLLAGASATTLGLTLFGIGYVFLLLRNRAWLAGKDMDVGEFQAKLLLVAAAITSSFFYLSTHLHENHLFMTIPLLIAISGRSAKYAWIMLAASVAATFNMMLHDIELPYSLGFASALSNTPNLHPAVGGDYTTWLQFVGGYVNSAVVTGLVISIFLFACAQTREEKASFK